MHEVCIHLHFFLCLPECLGTLKWLSVGNISVNYDCFTGV